MFVGKEHKSVLGLLSSSIRESLLFPLRSVAEFPGSFARISASYAKICAQRIHVADSQLLIADLS